MGRVYLDHHATTPLDPRVFEAMRPWFLEKFGNASSRTHAYGREARDAVEAARAEVAALVGAEPAEIVFTSGATESDNLALKGALQAAGKGRLVTVVTEHPAVLDPARVLRESGAAEVELLPVGADGLLDPARLEAAVRPGTVLVSVMAANNEIGVLQDLEAIGRICRAKGALFHTDAAQANGRIPLDAEAQGFDLASLSAHKMHGPKGVGALVVRKRHPRIRLAPQIDGGGHEDGLRSGTLNVPAIVGFGAACAIARRELPAEAARLRLLRERLWTALLPLGGVRRNGHAERRLPGSLSVSFEGVEGESLVEAMGEIAVSSTAACSTAQAKPSHVLRAIGVPEPLAAATLRFGLGRFTTAEEIDRAAGAAKAAVARLRA